MTDHQKTSKPRQDAPPPQPDPSLIGYIERSQKPGRRRNHKKLPSKS